MAINYNYQPLITDPMTGKVTRSSALSVPTPRQTLLPKDAQKVYRTPEGALQKKTAVDFYGALPQRFAINPMTTPEAAGFPAIESGMTGEGGATGIAGYFGAADKRGRIALDPQSGKPTALGFMPVTDREAEVARVAEREASGRAQALEDVAYLDRKKAENEALNQRLQATANIGWAMDNPSAPGARAIIANYQQYNKENLAKEQRAPQQSLGQEIAGIREAVGRSSAIPFDIAGKKAQADLYSAQAEAHRAQTQALPQQNALKAATAIAQAKAKLSESNSKLWSDMVATGNESAILALGTRPEFREMVAAYRAAQQLASEG